jgi:hypothetical protein
MPNLPLGPEDSSNAPNIPQTSASAPIVGDAISEDDVERLKQFRGSFLPDSRITAQETYAKWLFGLTTTIAALGSGFSNSAFAKLSNLGVYLYSLAVIAAGIGVLFSVWTLSEEVKDANWNDFETMNDKLTQLMHQKKKLLRWATIFFSASLILAGASPFVTAVERRPATPSHGIVMNISGRSLEPGILLTGLRPGATARLEIYKIASSKTELAATFLEVADDLGKIEFKGTKFDATSEQQQLKAKLTYTRGGENQSEEEEFTIPQAPIDAKKNGSAKPKTPSKPRSKTAELANPAQPI